MEKIFILGNESSKEWANDFGEIITVPSSLSVDDFAGIHDFTCQLFQVKEKPSKIIIDLDAVKPEIGLYIALHMRLSPADIGDAVLLPILFVSDLQLQSYLSYGESSQLFLCPQGVAFCHPDDAKESISMMESLGCDDYQTSFLDYIQIHPDATIGHHSLANQWGADVLWRMISHDAFPENESIKEAKKTLYFKYVFAKTIEDLRIFTNPTTKVGKVKQYNSLVNALGKKILLIDDEASKGWYDVLDRMLVGKSCFHVIKEKVPNYDSFSEDARTKIELGDYDLIFLDLRMNGVAEENVLDPDKFSGMDILNHIKLLNKGTQVIILTASNKAWNLKALFDAGADGYYTKESPELLFPNEVSYSNYVALQKTIKQCFERGYLRRIYPKIETLKKLLQQYNYFGDETDIMLGNIDVAFDLLAKSDEVNEYKAYSFLQLFLVIEKYVGLESVFDKSDTNVYLYNESNRYLILKDGEQEENSMATKYQSVVTFEHPYFIYNSGGSYTARFIETFFKVSVLLIFKFGKSSSNELNWPILNKKRNEFAHSGAEIKDKDIECLLDFMFFIFDESNACWRDVKDAFPEESLEEKIKKLQEKFGNINIENKEN